MQTAGPPPKPPGRVALGQDTAFELTSHTQVPPPESPEHPGHATEVRPGQGDQAVWLLPSSLIFPYFIIF